MKKEEEAVIEKVADETGVEAIVEAEPVVEETAEE